MTTSESKTVVPVILSGGSGTRLWPLSREFLPKQLLSLMSERSTLLQDTVQRVRGVPGCVSPVMVCNEAHRFLVAEQLQALGVESARILLEPTGRNTAPAVALAAHAVIEQYGPQAVMLVLPADHVLRDVPAFERAVQRALPAAHQGHLVTFGVVPTAPETGYGYIRRGDTGATAGLGSGVLSGVRPGAEDPAPIAQFTEKPALAEAEAFIRSGEYLWNSGMFLFTAQSYLTALQDHAPQIDTIVGEAFEARQTDGLFIRVSETQFARCPSVSIDYAVMEHANNGMVVALDAGWSDVGSWSSLWAALQPDEVGNVLRGDVLTHDTHESLVLAQSRLVATVGLDRCVVVETPDAVLVAGQEYVQQVKHVVDTLRERGRSESALHREVHRPWGSYDGLDRGEGYQVKRLRIKPGGAISLQRHHQRAEHWVVVAGEALITRDQETFTLRANESTYIPVGAIHRIENRGVTALEIIEVQTGGYLGEDDIERFEDQYGR